MNFTLDTKRISAAVLALSVTGLAGAQGVVQSWVDRYDGAGQGAGGTDRGFAVSFDSQGNAVVGGYSVEPTGGSYLAIKYAPDGTRLWVTASATISPGIGRTMTLDHADNVIVVGQAGSLGMSFGILKLDAAGNELWSNTYAPGSGFVTRFEGVATDPTGDIYAYGNQIAGATGEPAIFVVKYAADGTFLWDVVYATPSSWGRGIAATADGVYVVGNSEVASNDEDLLVLKIMPSGAIDWVRTFGRTALFANDTAWDVAIDSSGNVVAAGLYSGNGNAAVSTDFAVVRVAPDGTVLSDAAYDGPLGLYDEAFTLALDADDNAFLAGFTQAPEGAYDVLTAKIDPAGNAVWAQTFAGLPDFIDRPYDMAVDDEGSVYVAGETWSSGLIRQYFTVKYNAAGTKEWEQLYGGPTFDQSFGMAVAVSSDFRVAVTGYSGATGPLGDSDVATVCYEQPVAGDANGDRIVNVADLVAVILAWGTSDSAADVNDDGIVNVNDLVTVITRWG